MAITKTRTRKIHVHENFPKARYHGKVIVRAKGGYVVDGEWFKTFADAADSIE